MTDIFRLSIGIPHPQTDDGVMPVGYGRGDDAEATKFMLRPPAGLALKRGYVLMAHRISDDVLERFSLVRRGGRSPECALASEATVPLPAIVRRTNAGVQFDPDYFKKHADSWYSGVTTVAPLLWIATMAGARKELVARAACAPIEHLLQGVDESLHTAALEMTRRALREVREWEPKMPYPSAISRAVSRWNAAGVGGDNRLESVSELLLFIDRMMDIDPKPRLGKNPLDLSVRETVDGLAVLDEHMIRHFGRDLMQGRRAATVKALAPTMVRMREELPTSEVLLGVALGRWRAFFPRWT